MATSSQPQFVYYTSDGDVLDAILYKYYGDDVSMLELVYAANPGLADLGPVYGSLIPIILPPMPAVPATKLIMPWTT